MDRINLGIIGTGWCAGIRAETAYANPLVDQLYIVDNRPERLKEMQPKCLPAGSTTDYTEIISNPDISAVMISATPETTHYPMAKAALEAGKHVFLEKPIAIELAEADDLVAISKKII